MTRTKHGYNAETAEKCVYAPYTQQYIEWMNDYNFGVWVRAFLADIIQPKCIVCNQPEPLKHVKLCAFCFAQKNFNDECLSFMQSTRVTPDYHDYTLGEFMNVFEDDLCFHDVCEGHDLLLKAETNGFYKQ